MTTAQTASPIRAEPEDSPERGGMPHNRDSRGESLPKRNHPHNLPNRSFGEYLLDGEGGTGADGIREARTVNRP